MSKENYLTDANMHVYQQNDKVEFFINNDLGPMEGLIQGQATTPFPFCGAGWIVKVTKGSIPNSTYPYDTMVVMESAITNHPRFVVSN